MSRDRIKHILARTPREPVRALTGYVPYRLGNKVSVPANTPVVSATIVGSSQKYNRYKITIAALTPEGETLSATDARFLDWELLCTVENDRITRSGRLSAVNGAQVVYAGGYAIDLRVGNPTAQDLDLHWSVDEDVAGLAKWEDAEEFLNLAIETVLAIPPFCDSLYVFSPGAAAIAPRLRGYNSTGTLMFDEVLPTPRSAEIQLTPGMLYTITPAAGVSTHAVLYTCIG